MNYNILKRWRRLQCMPGKLAVEVDTLEKMLSFLSSCFLFELSKLGDDNDQLQPLVGGTESCPLPLTLFSVSTNARCTSGAVHYFNVCIIVSMYKADLKRNGAKRGLLINFITVLCLIATWTLNFSMEGKSANLPKNSWSQRTAFDVFNPVRTVWQTVGHLKKIALSFLELRQELTQLWCSAWKRKQQCVHLRKFRLSRKIIAPSGRRPRGSTDDYCPIRS